jgi:hypothetical protein
VSSDSLAQLALSLLLSCAVAAAVAAQPPADLPPAERELVKQIEMMQASATKLKACRQPPLRSKKDKEE